MDEVRLDMHDPGVAVLTLNRPKALNALNGRMVEALLLHFSGISGLSAKARCLLLQGAGGKAYCAGGDVKSAVLDAMAGRISTPLNFFRTEYQMNLALANFKPPTVALLDGIVMGGGVGVSVHAPFRVATERTVFAMPECGIGLFPDVGASFFLNTCPGRLGMYLGLTGARLSGVEVKEARLATHCIASAALPLVLPGLQQLGMAAADLSQVHRLLCRLEAEHPPPPPASFASSSPSPPSAGATISAAASSASTTHTHTLQMPTRPTSYAAGSSATAANGAALAGSSGSNCVAGGGEPADSAHTAGAQFVDSGASVLSQRRVLIDTHFGHDSLEEVVTSLQRCANAPGVSHSGVAVPPEALVSLEFAKETLAMLAKGSPLSQAITFKLLLRMRHATLASCLATDWALVGHFVAGDGDFFEGVRATLIERGTQPAWKYASLAEVPPEVVDSFFELRQGIAPLFTVSSSSSSDGIGNLEPVSKL